MIRLNADEAARTRVLLLDSRGRIIAASDRTCDLDEVFELQHGGEPLSSYRDARGRTIAFHHTPGYETYRGLGWYGALVQAG